MPLLVARNSANHAGYSSVHVTFCGSWTHSLLKQYLGKKLDRKLRLSLSEISFLRNNDEQCNTEESLQNEPPSHDNVKNMSRSQFRNSVAHVGVPGMVFSMCGNYYGK